MLRVSLESECKGGRPGAIVTVVILFYLACTSTSGTSQAVLVSCWIRRCARATFIDVGNLQTAMSHESRCAFSLVFSGATLNVDLNRSREVMVRRRIWNWAVF